MGVAVKGSGAVFAGMPDAEDLDLGLRRDVLVANDIFPSAEPHDQLAPSIRRQAAAVWELLQSPNAPQDEIARAAASGFTGNKKA
jgi:hypothetical protein